MKINLEQHELIIAVQEYIANQGLDIRNKEVRVDFIAGRGKDSAGHRAEVEILAATVSEEEVEEAAISADETPAVPEFSFDGDEEEPV